MNKKKVIESINPLFLKGIAHRGLHDNKEVTENSLNAFKAAKDESMAFELDVHLTKDDVMVVIHDSTLLRVTGKEGIVEDLTYEELQRDYRLLDGEKIPTLKEVLDQTCEVVPIVIELKVFRKNYKPLALKLKEELKDIKDKKNFMIISFDPRGLICFGKCGFIRSLLVTYDKKYRPLYHARRLFESLDIDQRFFKEVKSSRRYKRHHLVNCWTVETLDDLAYDLEYADTVTFQYIDPNKVKSVL